MQFFTSNCTDKYDFFKTEDEITLTDDFNRSLNKAELMVDLSLQSVSIKHWFPYGENEWEFMDCCHEMNLVSRQQKF